MIKILDNSVISTMYMDMVSVDLLQILRPLYTVSITDAVIIELSRLGNEELIRSIADLRSTSERDERFMRAKDRIRRIDPRLGDGEVECIAESMMLTRSGIGNYVVLDDLKAREAIDRIRVDPELESVLGAPIPPVRYTGTIGLVKHLKDRGILSAETCSGIAFDLEAGGFRVTKELLDLIR